MRSHVRCRLISETIRDARGEWLALHDPRGPPIRGGELLSLNANGLTKCAWLQLSGPLCIVSDCCLEDQH